MISRRAALRAGKKLNDHVDALRSRNQQVPAYMRMMSDRDIEDVEKAVRTANEVIYQYNNMPKDVREFWWTGRVEVNGDGVHVPDRDQE